MYALPVCLVRRYTEGRALEVVVDPPRNASYRSLTPGAMSQVTRYPRMPPPNRYRPLDICQTAALRAA